MNVFKYKLKIQDYQKVLISKGAELLCVKIQFGEICLWARVDPMAQSEERLIRMAGTGHPNVEGKYVDTFFIQEGALVFHVFDCGDAL